MNKEELIDKLIKYKNKREKTLDWPYHRLLEIIVDDVIEIVKEVEE